MYVYASTVSHGLSLSIATQDAIVTFSNLDKWLRFRQLEKRTSSVVDTAVNNTFNFLFVIFLTFSFVAQVIRRCELFVTSQCCLYSCAMFCDRFSYKHQFASASLYTALLLLSFSRPIYANAVDSIKCTCIPEIGSDEITGIESESSRRYPFPYNKFRSVIVPREGIYLPRQTGALKNSAV